MTAAPLVARSGAPTGTDDLALMLLIRHVELALLRLVAEGSLSGTTHTCLGQEYVPVALSALLTDDDFVFSNHRGHGHYLARFRDPAGLLAELTGRAGAPGNGVGGSQHVYRDRFLSTGVQGESASVGLGVALHRRRTGTPGVAVVYVGDGTWGEGALYEALNMASLWTAPLVLVVENNGIAQSTPAAAHTAGDIGARARAFDVGHVRLDGCDVADLRARVDGPLARVRDGGGPLVLEFVTRRLGPHSKGDDTRPAGELDRLRAGDWAHHYRRAFGDRFDELDETARAEVAAAVAEVATRPESEWEEAPWNASSRT